MIATQKWPAGSVVLRDRFALRSRIYPCVPSTNRFPGETFDALRWPTQDIALQLLEPEYMNLLSTLAVNDRERDTVTYKALEHWSYDVSFTYRELTSSDVSVATMVSLQPRKQTWDREKFLKAVLISLSNSYNFFSTGNAGALAITDKNSSSAPVPGVYASLPPQVVRFNHSCEPNAGMLEIGAGDGTERRQAFDKLLYGVFSVEAPKAKPYVVVAERDIAEGEELTISYKPEITYYTNIDGCQAGMLHAMHFQCMCTRCTCPSSSALEVRLNLMTRPYKDVAEQQLWQTCYEGLVACIRSFDGRAVALSAIHAFLFDAEAFFTKFPGADTHWMRRHILRDATQFASFAVDHCTRDDVQVLAPLTQLVHAHFREQVSSNAKVMSPLSVAKCFALTRFLDISTSQYQVKLDNDQTIKTSRHSVTASSSSDVMDQTCFDEVIKFAMQIDSHTDAYLQMQQRLLLC